MERIEEQAGVVRTALGQRSIVLVGMMGAGKSAIGRLLAKALNLPFIDADTEIERAAGMTIPDMFEAHGEAYFRDGEVRVISRILDGAPCVLATGGGAWMDADTRAHASRVGISVWLKAEPEVLLKRVKRRSNRPMLKTKDPEATLRHLLALRDPVYAQADVTVGSRDVPHETMVLETLTAIAAHVTPVEQTAE
ncbi:shikimate kinase [Agaricicola taiwanensis]|uniref:Shikimate kinase n=2 Tax=Agaricicola taiwanensis TaxID=591372 RepID=A0A8J3DZY5_9RHOB|nr:shikimate kinase [Agaricicola taiwanensis]